jgi:hypothetical protein
MQFFLEQILEARGGMGTREAFSKLDRPPCQNSAIFVLSSAIIILQVLDQIAEGVATGRCGGQLTAPTMIGRKHNCVLEPATVCLCNYREVQPARCFFGHFSMRGDATNFVNVHTLALTMQSSISLRALLDTGSGFAA